MQENDYIPFRKPFVPVLKKHAYGLLLWGTAFLIMGGSRMSIKNPSDYPLGFLLLYIFIV